jgi:hypothetical protein
MKNNKIYNNNNHKKEVFNAPLSSFFINQVQVGGKLQDGHTSHYTLVKKKHASRNICQSGNDFEQIEGLITFFPTECGEEAEGDEIVLFNSAHVLPRYIVHYSTVSDNFLLPLPCGPWHPKKIILAFENALQSMEF